MSKMYSPMATSDWKLIDSPERPACVPEDGPVEIFTTEHGERFDDAGHSIQEDIGPVLAARVVTFLQANP